MGIDILCPIFETLEQAKQWALANLDLEDKDLNVSITDTSNNKIIFEINHLDILVFEIAQDMKALDAT